MLTHDLQYIEQRGDKYRVRFPKSLLSKRWLGTYDTPQQAITARDLFLGEVATQKDSPVNESPVLPIPERAWDAKPLQLPLDDMWLYCADLHSPAFSSRMVDRLIRVARHYDIKRLVIGGDVTDQATISQWPNITPQHGLDYSQEATGMLLSYLGDVFEEIDIFTGNHDQRFAKKLGTRITLESVLWSCIKSRRFRAKLQASDFIFALFGEEGDGGPDTGIVAGHPTFFGSIAAKTLSEVAMLKHRHVLGSHNHLQGFMWSKCGRYWAIDPGCMADASNTPYHQLGDGISKFGAWKQGFVLMRRNVPQIMADGLVDWKQFGAE